MSKTNPKLDNNNVDLDILYSLLYAKLEEYCNKNNLCIYNMRSLRNYNRSNLKGNILPLNYTPRNTNRFYDHMIEYISPTNQAFYKSEEANEIIKNNLEKYTISEKDAETKIKTNISINEEDPEETIKAKIEAKIKANIKAKIKANIPTKEKFDSISSMKKSTQSKLFYQRIYNYISNSYNFQTSRPAKLILSRDDIDSMLSNRSIFSCIFFTCLAYSIAKGESIPQKANINIWEKFKGAALKNLKILLTTTLNDTLNYTSYEAYGDFLSICKHQRKTIGTNPKVDQTILLNLYDRFLNYLFPDQLFTLICILEGNLNNPNKLNLTHSSNYADLSTCTNVLIDHIFTICFFESKEYQEYFFATITKLISEQPLDSDLVIKINTTGINLTNQYEKYKSDFITKYNNELNSYDSIIQLIQEKEGSLSH